MTLSTLQTKLSDLGFETQIHDNVLSGARETGDAAVEMIIDSGGGCLVVKKTREPGKNRSFNFKGKRIPIVCEKLSTETFRVQLESDEDFDLIEKEIE